MRKLRMERNLCLVSVILGFVIFVCNLAKIAPGCETLITYAITTIIAFGFLVGPALIILGISGLCDVSSKLKRMRRRRAR